MGQANKSKKTKKEKWNFKPWLIIAAVLLVILGITALVTYCSGHKSVLKFSYENGQYTDSKNDITYVEAPSCYQAKAITSGDYPYATSNRWTLYRVGYRDKDEKLHLVSGSLWLSTSMADGARLYYNPDKAALPDFVDFKGDTIYICNADESLFSTTALDSVTTEQLLSDFFGSADSEYDRLFASCKLEKNLKVSSSEYNWLYLNLWLYSDSDGHYYLYEETTQKFLPTDDKLFEPLLRESSGS